VNGGPFDITPGTDGEVEASVIVPARNAAATIDEQLRALLAQQTDRRFEVLVIDDGSTDATATLVDGWAAVDERVRLLRAAPAGSYAARNVGAEAARSDLLLFCDADDVVSDGWVDAMRTALDQWPLVGGPLDLNRLNRPIVQRWRSTSASDEAPVFAGFLPFTPAANLGVRRSVFTDSGGFNGRALNGDDVGFCWRAQRAAHPMGWAPDALVHYRGRPTLRAHLAQQYRFGHSMLEQGRGYARHGAWVPTMAFSLLDIAAGLYRAASAVGHADVGTAGRELGRAAFHVGAVRHRFDHRPASCASPDVDWPSPRAELRALLRDLPLELRRKLRKR
jgi:glycosyltransferase involved in cell wall biosynthesis